MPAQLLAAVLCIILAVLCWILFTFHNDEPYQEGIAYLDAQQQKDVSALETSLNARRMQQLAQAVEEGRISVFSLFSNSIILGDSRALGFSEYGFLPESQVRAVLGYTIENASEFTDVVQSMQPDVIYLSYGVNDTAKNVGGNLGENGYAQVFEQQVDSLLAVSPNSKIVINSIIPVSEIGQEETVGWENIDAFNAQLADLAARRGWIFVDNNVLAANGTADIYEPDGIHFHKDFYPLWAEYMTSAAQAE